MAEGTVDTRQATPPTCPIARDCALIAGLIAGSGGAGAGLVDPGTGRPRSPRRMPKGFIRRDIVIWNMMFKITMPSPGLGTATVPLTAEGGGTPLPPHPFDAGTAG